MSRFAGFGISAKANATGLPRLINGYGKAF